MITESGRRIERAKLLIDQGRWKEAASELVQALSSQEDRSSALYWLAWAHLQSGSLEEAEATAARLIAEDPERASGYYMRSLVVEEMSKLARGHYPLSVVLESGNKLKLAEEMARIALRKAPDVPDYRAHLGWILADLKRHQEALKLMEEGLSENPEAVRLHQVRTEALLVLGRVSDAEESARRAIAIDPQNPTNMAQLGAVSFKKKDFAAAQEHFAAALRLAPTYVYAREGLLKTLRARTWIYRLFAQKKPSRKWTVWQNYALIFGVAFGMRAVLALPGGPEIAMTLMCLITAIGAFVVVRWYVMAVFNSLSALELRLYPIGRAALSLDELRNSNYLGLMLLGVIAAFVAAAAGIRLGYWIGGLLLFLVIPVGKTLGATGARRRAALAHTSVLTALAIGALACITFHKYMSAGWLLLIFLFGWLCFEPFTSREPGLP